MWLSCFAEGTVDMIMEMIIMLLKGLLLNVVITAIAAVVPLVLGILLSLLAGKAKVFASICSWLNIGCEAIAIPLLICVVYYLPGILFGFQSIDQFFYTRIAVEDMGRILSVVLVLGMAFFWYMPAKYNTAYSCVKNILYNGLGLISNLFKWSFVACVLSCTDLFRVALNFTVAKADIFPLLIALLITGIFLGVIALARAIIKQFVK